MKISTLVSAGLAVGLVGTTLLPAAAIAGQERTVTTTRTTVRTVDNRPRRGYHTRRVCRMTYRNHHRVRVCRVVRYR